MMSLFDLPLLLGAAHHIVFLIWWPTRLQYYLVMGVFSLLTPLGAAIGMLVRAESSGSSVGAGFCTALGAGTFIHVAAMEVRRGCWLAPLLAACCRPVLVVVCDVCFFFALLVLECRSCFFCFLCCVFASGQLFQ